MPVVLFDSFSELSVYLGQGPHLEICPGFLQSPPGRLSGAGKNRPASFAPYHGTLPHFHCTQAHSSSASALPAQIRALRDRPDPEANPLQIWRLEVGLRNEPQSRENLGGKISDFPSRAFPSAALRRGFRLRKLHPRVIPYHVTAS
jgi:hypothetical protein